MKAQLPPGASRQAGKIVVDPDAFYPAILAEIEANKAVMAQRVGKDIAMRYDHLDAKKPDQYWLEVIYQFAKLEVLRTIVGTEDDPRPESPPIIKISPKDAKVKERWAIRNAPAGPLGDGKNDPKWDDAAQAKFKWYPAYVATAKREAREHYKALRGQLPG